MRRNAQDDVDSQSHNNASWEFMLTAGFEFDVLRGKRPYRRTIWVSLYAQAIGYPYDLHRISYI
jgi:hypothetical protein